MPDFAHHFYQDEADEQYASDQIEGGVVARVAGDCAFVIDCGAGACGGGVTGAAGGLVCTFDALVHPLPGFLAGFFEAAVEEMFDPIEFAFEVHGWWRFK